MGLIDIPDFFSDAIVAHLEKQVIQALMSHFLSQEITLAWRSGDAKWAGFIGENKALKDAATAGYLALKEKGIDLVVPADMLAQPNLDGFKIVKGDKK